MVDVYMMGVDGVGGCYVDWYDVYKFWLCGDFVV